MTNWQDYLVKHGCKLGKRYEFQFKDGGIVCTPEEFSGFYDTYVADRPQDTEFHILPLYDFEDDGVSYIC